MAEAEAAEAAAAGWLVLRLNITWLSRDKLRAPSGNDSPLAYGSICGLGHPDAAFSSSEA